VSVESPFRQHTQFDLEQDHKMNMTYRRVLVSPWPLPALKRASPAEQPRELIDRTSMSRATLGAAPEKLK
jgi:hypothetical protein